MTIPTQLSRRSLLGGLGGALLLGACSNSNDAGDTAIDWWHINNTDPILSIWAGIAKEFEAAHAGTKINITPLENEAFKAKLTTVTQAGNPPDLFHSWGGGVLKQQVDAGLVQDLTGAVGSWIGNLTPVAVQPYTIDGKVYGIPFDVGMVGFWYNKDHFAKAGISEPPTTWAGLLDAVQKLKSAGLTPIALAGADKWPGHFYWAYLAIRIAGIDGLARAAEQKSFTDASFVAAGQRLKELVDLKPFQEGFLAATYSSPDGQAAAMGNGQAAMELMGQWAPSVQDSSSTSKEGIGDKLGFFPFPSVDGGLGKVTDVFGGGNGYTVGRDAPKSTVDFLGYLLDVANQRKAAETGSVLPVTKGAEDAIKDPNLATVHKALTEATGFQLYLDQAYPPAVGQQVNDSVAELVAGSASPEQVTEAITTVAKSA